MTHPPPHQDDGIPYLMLLGPDAQEGSYADADDVIINPTLLLSALEACGIDNARCAGRGAGVCRCLRVGRRAVSGAVCLMVKSVRVGPQLLLQRLHIIFIYIQQD